MRVMLADRRSITVHAVVLLAFGMLLCVPVRAVAGDGAQAGCSNESVRFEIGATWLAECRAYETVTPPYKEGYEFVVNSYSRDGNKAILYSLANVAGNLGASESILYGASYLAVRTEGGWRLSPLNASLSEFVGQVPEAFEADSGETLWMQHTPEQSAFTRDLYARSPSGVYSLIGSVSPPSGVEEEASDVLEGEVGSAGFNYPVATTSDYGHVVLFAESERDYWAGFDKTEGGSGSLYEYAGTGNESPTLIGVQGAKGSTLLIGRCGTQLGAGRGRSAYNAISSDGEAVFFTVEPKDSGSCAAPIEGPAWPEVYARVHGSPKVPASAETLHVSASECTVECGGAPGESGKNFEGASESGEQVFFTSTQKLTNNAVDEAASGNAAKGEGCANAALNGGGCNLYEYNFSVPMEASRLSLIAGGEVMGVAAIAEDGSRIYFVSGSQLAPVGPIKGAPNLYVYDTASKTTAFIATLSSEDERDWERNFERPVEVAGEAGRYLLFESFAHLTADDTSSQRQLFEYDAVTGELVRLTKGEDGFNENGNGVEAGIEPTALVSFVEKLGNGHDFKSVTERQNVSGDGRTVFFVTAGELSPRATSAQAGCRSLYEFHTGGLLREGAVSLISDGRDVQPNKGSTCGAQLQAVDESGDNVLFTSADSLVGPSGVDGVERDVFDARVGGGFPPAGESGLCGLGSCEGGVSVPPVFGAPASVGEAGEAPVPAVVSPSENHKAASHKKPKKAKVKEGRVKKKKGKGRASGRRRRSGVGSGVVVVRGVGVGRGV
jgi:hypothetical protein